jgi:hypothetical protein
MRWPWHPRKTTTERKQAETHAAQVHAEVVRPLREMRAREYLTGAITADIARRLQEGQW